MPTDFIGFLRPDDATSDREGHDELMANFFAQPDALAVGRAFEAWVDLREANLRRAKLARKVVARMRGELVQTVRAPPPPPNDPPPS